MSTSSTPLEGSLVSLTADVVGVYVSNQPLPAADLAGLISAVHASLVSISNPVVPAVDTVAKPTPQQIRRSITDDHLVSFIDGKSYKTLKRHLGNHGLDFEGYRARFGLPSDYPSTSKNYSEQRRNLAVSLGLGKQRRKGAAPEPAPVEEPVVAAPKKRPARKKAAA